MKAARPTKTMERQTIAPDRRANDGQSSTPVAGAVGVTAVWWRGERTAAAQSAAPATAGRASRGEAPSPPGATTAATSGGARAKPTLPPRENQPMAVLLPPAAARAARAASGW